MAQADTNTPTESPDAPTPEYETGTFPVPGEEDLSSRAESAREEHMVVVPEFDAYGICLGEYELTSESGSVYMVERTGCECPDARFNSPENGCKHFHRVQLEHDQPGFPIDGEEVHEYMEGRVLPLLQSFADERESLVEAKAHADADDLEAYEETLQQVEMFMVTLADAYDRYAEAMDGDVPEREVETPEEGE